MHLHSPKTRLRWTCFRGFFSLLQPEEESEARPVAGGGGGEGRSADGSTPPYRSAFRRRQHKPWEGGALPFNEIQLDDWVGCFNYTNGMSRGWREFLPRVAAIQDFLHETLMEPA